ncbi:MAG: hypothetical protein GWP05_09020 [Anaerolineaceae bacterium]|nr:hypothetical protein [Anaerolineaceae bacterium]
MKLIGTALAFVMIFAATAGAAVYTVDRNHPKAAAGQRVVLSGADPKFRNAAKGIAVTDYRRVQDCTTTKFVLHGGASLFTVGDHVELDFDGVVRKVTETGPDYIVVDKPLKKPPTTMQSIANWGSKTDFAWDLRLADDSPAKGAGPDGKDIGSSLDIRAYIKGDFNGDLRRDLPVLPPQEARIAAGGF